MARNQLLSLGLTMLVSFAVSFGILWRQRQTVEMPGSMSTMSSTSGESSKVVGALVPSSPRATSAGPAASTSAVSAVPPGPVTARIVVESVGNADDAKELPVIFNIDKTEAYVRDESNGGRMVYKSVYEGIISNVSGESLDITVTEVNLPTMASTPIQFSLSPGMQKHIGIDQGLEMLSGDQVTARSAGYRELARMIP